jgi:hypothetical protein
MSFDIRDGGVIAARSEDGPPCSWTTTGIAILVMYSDPGDAAAELLDALSAVPGLTPAEWPEASGEMDLVVGAEATPVSMEMGEPLGERRLHVTVGDDTASCAAYMTIAGWSATTLDHPQGLACLAVGVGSVAEGLDARRGYLVDLLACRPEPVALEVAGLVRDQGDGRPDPECGQRAPVAPLRGRCAPH